jgi:hypothetical protein
MSFYFEYTDEGKVEYLVLTSESGRPEYRINCDWWTNGHEVVGSIKSRLGIDYSARRSVIPYNIRMRIFNVIGGDVNLGHTAEQRLEDDVPF